MKQWMMHCAVACVLQAGLTTSAMAQTAPNDSCPLAAEIRVDEPVVSDNFDATDNLDVPACGTSAPSGGLWYVVMGTGNTMSATTCSPVTFEADFDTKLQVFCNCDEYTCIDGNDDVDCFIEGLLSTVTWCSLAGQPYYIHVGGAAGEAGVFELLVTDDGTPCDDALDCGGPVIPECAVSTYKYEVKKDALKWEIINEGDTTLTVSSITINWPDQYGDIKEIKFKGKIFEDDFLAPPTATITEFDGELKDRQIKAGKKQKLEFKFTEKVEKEDASSPYEFYVYVEFEEGCYVEFLPGEEPEGEFACDKPVDALTFFWYGTEAVRVMAYKGDVGAELLADIDDVLVGDEITVSGFAGSPNNVYFEIYAAGTDDKLGESTFHLSCSDDDMDGPEDCGKRAGNGKSNNPQMINDWLLEGMVDSIGPFDCTP